MNAWIAKLTETFIETGYYKMLLNGLGNTLVMTLGALCIGVVIGTLIAVVKYFAEDVPALKPLDLLCELYIAVIRGIPVVVLLLIFFYLILTSADGITVGIIAFGINSGAYMAELIRSGINAVDKGQMEAARSLGLTYGMGMRHIVLPQAIKTMIPSIINQFIITLKDTSILSVIGFPELVNTAKNVVAATFLSFQTWGIVAIMYLIVILLLQWAAKVLERRLKYESR